jgi:hypothetical protein
MELICRFLECDGAATASSRILEAVFEDGTNTEGRTMKRSRSTSCAARFVTPVALVTVLLHAAVGVFAGADGDVDGLPCEGCDVTNLGCTDVTGVITTTDCATDFGAPVDF